MRMRWVWCCVAMLCVTPPAGTAQDTAPQAEAVWGRLTRAMGGMEAFQAPRYLLFQFVVQSKGETVADYDHAWDRQTGDYRLTGVNEEGKPFIALFNIHRYEKGVAWVDGKQLDGDALTLMLRSAYQRFINDSYWLLMPWKWEDPGVHLEMQDPQMMDGSTYDVVNLTFDQGIGLTSRDRYWAYVSRENGLMEHWGFILEGTDATEPSLWDWEDWEDAGNGVLLSRRKSNRERDLAIVFPKAQLTDTVPETLFTKP